MSDEDWNALARAVRARRTDLGLSQAAVAASGGPSDFVISRIENNDEPRPRPDTLRKLDRALRWEAGTSQAIVASGEAPPTPPRVRVRTNRNGEWGQWREVDPAAEPAPRLTPEELLEKATTTAQEHAEMIGRLLLVPLLNLTQAERERIERIRTDIARLPGVLAPWLDTAAGNMQFLRQMSTHVNEAYRIFRTAQQRHDLTDTHD
ncbi:helix-turn-helix domain-containing protein [Mycolicibacterium goodii]|uniref:Helix-turn-helix domain-containing protein n=1 Tax=Mycolicibacterium goodii TaxID=134601 RepID=A0ABS6HUW3_MYCGD|nr:helix-turn-helix transcriptional regulator [Mycolicibacterium goodii]MBU8826467.1 helix-turn-helix domain-containing protein [Mycolicibacterium goodii]